MEKEPILSICIPTDGSVQWVLPVLDSIYSQDADMSLYEVVITDNGKESQLPQYLGKYEYPNLRYRQTNDKGFLNLVTALKDGKGLFCKMLNHRSVLLPGAINKWIEMVEQYKNTKPIIYCADANVKGGDVIECKDINDFLVNLSIYATWSAGIGFWQDDLPLIDNIQLDEMFPNTSMILNIREGAEYVIWNYKYQTMEDESGKGGYDYFYTFGVGFLDILNELRIKDKIKKQTFVCVKLKLYDFLKEVYLREVFLPTNHTFILDNIKDSFSIYFGSYYYWRMVVYAIVHYPWGLVKYIGRRMMQKRR